MKLIRDIWFSTMGGTVGIVLTEDENIGEHKAYIGVVGGYNMRADQQHIMDHGQKLPCAIVQEIATWLKPEKKRGKR